MREYVRYIIVTCLLASCFTLASCSGGSSSKKTVDEESIYSPGAAIGAVEYKDACRIEVLVQGESGDFVLAHDGQFIEPGKKLLRVKIEGDPEDISKVLISDGALNQVEAIKQGDYYQTEYDVISEHPYTSILVQAVHKGDRASKEKIVFRTFNEEPAGTIIRDGIGILATDDVLLSNSGLLAQELDTVLKQAFADIKMRYPGLISSLSYGDGDANTVDIEIVDLRAADNTSYPTSVVYLALIIHDVDMAAMNLKNQSLITTADNDLKVEMYLDVYDQGENNRRCLAFDLLGSPRVSFQKDFLLKTVFEGKIAAGLQVVEISPLVTELNTLFSTLRNRLPLSVMVNGSQVDLVSFLGKQNIDLSQYLFIDLYGVPEDTYKGVLALGSGLHLTKTRTAALKHSPIKMGTVPDIDGIIIDLCEGMVDKAFGSIKNQYQGLITTLSYGDANPYTHDLTINSLTIQDTGNVGVKYVRAVFTLNDVDFRAATLFGISLIHTQDNDLTIDASFLVSESESSGQTNLIMDVQEVFDVSFQDYFLGRNSIEQLAVSSLESLENTSKSIDSVVSSLSLDLDLTRYGYLGPEFPDVIDALTPYEWNLRMPAGNNLSLIISQDNLNYVLARLFAKGFEWDIHEMLLPLLSNDFKGTNAGTVSNQETILRFSVPPVFDLKSSEIRLQADDIFIEYRINGEPHWEASVDLDVVVEMRLVENELAFFVSPTAGRCNFHIMKDNVGNLGIFDHSNFVKDLIVQLPKMLGDSIGGPIFTIKLTSFEPLITLSRVERPMTITSEGGYLYIDMNALDVDLSVLKDIFVKM